MSNKYLIAGLGNPGAEYELTRHNIGFLVLDQLAEGAGVVFRSGRYGAIADTRLKNKSLLLLKPATFMNLSGKALRYWMQEHQVPLENVLVIMDDLALPLGQLRLRGKGSDGGHNGLKSINEVIGSQDYARLRFGIGNEYAKGYQVDYVLGKWSDEEWKLLPEKISTACDAVNAFVLSGLAASMSRYNQK